jgi:N-acetylglucosamine-6-sulfatase
VVRKGIWGAGTVTIASASLATLLIASAAPSTATAARPNVVVLMTDDQDVASMRVMDDTRRLIGRRGVKFVNSYVTTPLCCPSRATFHTGRYTHNHRVVANEGSRGGSGGFSRLVRPGQTLAVRLRRAGYRTGYVGKYFNQAGADGGFNVPRGWSRWVEAINHRMYNFVLNANGRPQVYGTSRRDYQTDVLARKALRFLSSSARRRKPFFLMLGMVAPHGDPDRPGAKQNPLAAPRHRTRFDHTPLRRPPSFNERDVSDKPRFIRRPPLRRGEKREIRARYRSRLESLLAADDAVEHIVHRLRRTGERHETVLIFTSDNGFLLGEHRKHGKALAYEEAAAVPLLIRGPGIPRGKRRTQIVGNVDLAPTILDLAGRSWARMDGRSLLPLVRNPNKAQGRDLLIEMLKGGGARPFKAIRSSRYLLVDHPGQVGELYDLARDPFQLHNRYRERPYRRVGRRLRSRLKVLAGCRRARCR